MAEGQRCEVCFDLDTPTSRVHTQPSCGHDVCEFCVKDGCPICSYDREPLRNCGFHEHNRPCDCDLC